MAETEDRSNGKGAYARGRPRRPEMDEAILQATAELLAERGLAGTTVTAIAARSGVARGSIYLRWPHRRQLIAAAGRRVMGEPMRFTGDLEADIVDGVQFTRGTLLRLHSADVLPAVVAGWAERRGGERLPFEVMAPGRGAFVREYRALASAAGMREDVDPNVVFDLVLGGLLARLFASGTLSAGDASELADVILNGARVRRCEPHDD